MIASALPSDFDFIYDLYMDAHINPHLLYEMMSKNDFMPIYEDLLQKQSKYVFIMDDIKVGMFKLYKHQFRNSHIAYLGGVAIQSKFNNKGFGKKMILEIIEFCRNRGFHKIELSVGSRNEKAKNLYLQTGFLVEGTLKDFTYLASEGRFIDEDLMAIIL